MPANDSETGLPEGSPVTTRIPLLPQHSFRPAPLQVSRPLQMHPRLLTLRSIDVYRSASIILKQPSQVGSLLTGGSVQTVQIARDEEGTGQI